MKISSYNYSPLFKNLDISRWAEQDCAFLNKNSRWDDWECRKDGGWFHTIKALCERHRSRVQKLKILSTFIIKAISSSASSQHYHRFPLLENHFDCNRNPDPFPEDNSSLVFASTKSNFNQVQIQPLRKKRRRRRRRRLRTRRQGTKRRS